VKVFSVVFLTCFLVNLLTCSLAFTQDFRTWEPGDGVAVRQGHHVEWYRSGAYRTEGEFAGEAAVAWSDTRNGERGIYIQVFNAEGEPRFPENGLEIVNAPSNQYDPVVTPCIDGGWFIAWIKLELEPPFDLFGDIYCTKISAEGEFLWGEPDIGLPVCVTQGVQEDIELIEDGLGGCLIAWKDQRGGDAGDIFCTHVLLDGRIDPDWEENGNLIIDEAGTQHHLEVISDNNGGMIIVWEDERRNGDPDIYAQWITPQGDLAWENGIQVCNDQSTQQCPRICSDGEGGAFIAWEDDRNMRDTDWDIYVQRLDQNGEALWGEPGEGVPICLAEWEQNRIRIISSEPGSAIVSWEDKRSDGTDIDIFAMRISGDEDLVFEWEDANGMPVTTVDRNQSSHKTCPDGNGGVYLVWEDERDGGFPEVDIWIQGVTADGQLYWEDDDIPVIGAPGTQGSPVVIPNINGRVYVFWSDQVSGSIEIRGQRMNDAGEILWNEEGEIVVTGISQNALFPQVLSRGDGTFAIIWLDGRNCWRGTFPFIQICENRDESPDFRLENHGISLQLNQPVGGGINIQSTLSSDDGIIVVWEDRRRGQPHSIYAQKISWEGEILWEEDGVQCAELDFDQKLPQVCNDGEGGAIIAWHNQTGAPYDIYLQRLDEAGNRMWGDEGFQFTDNDTDESVESLTSDGEGGVVIVWKQSFDNNDDLLIQRINDDHELLWEEDRAICEEMLDQKRSDIARHEDGYVVVWEDERVVDERYIFGQFINNDGSFRWNRFIGGYPICDGAFNPMYPVVECSEDGDIWVAWEDHRAGNRDIYLQKFTSETDDRGDPVILFREDDQPIHDGIPICVEEHHQIHPEILSDGNNGLWLTWEDNRGDALVKADIYATHLTSEGTPFEGWPENGAIVSGAIHKQKRPQIALIQDFGAEGVVLVWEDQRSTGKEELVNLYIQALDDGMVSVPDPAEVQPVDFKLFEAYPNPFNSSTKIGYQLPVSTDMSIKVFDIAGREVASLVEGVQSIGKHSVMWNASPTTAGVYFVKMGCTEFSSVQKVVLVK